MINEKECNIIHLIKNNIKIINSVNKEFKFKGILKIFKNEIKEMFKLISSVNKEEISDKEIKEKCNNFLEKFSNAFKRIIIDNFFEITFSVDKNNYKQNEFNDNIGRLNMDNSDEKFFVHFSESQMFISKFLSI